MKRLLTILSPVLVALALIVALLGLLPQGVGAEGEPPAGTVNSIQNYTLYSSQQITSPGAVATVNTDSQHVQFWNAADVFVNVDVASAATATFKVQLSPDDSIFADADYEYADADELLTKAYTRAMTADGTEYMRVPVAGRYIRVSITYSGTVTPSVIATMRNN